MNNEPTFKDGITELGIFEKDMQAFASSVDLARVFDKPHNDVMKVIKKTVESCDVQFSQGNITQSKYKDIRGKNQPSYNLTRKGFTLVAMGFTGKKAMDYKVKYINAFESMHELISSRILSKNGYKEMTKSIKTYIGDYLKQNLKREPTYFEYMKVDIKAMLECDAVLMLPGWIFSKGAMIEWIIAKLFKIKVFYNVDKINQQ